MLNIILMRRGFKPIHHGRMVWLPCFAAGLIRAPAPESGARHQLLDGWVGVGLVAGGLRRIAKWRTRANESTRYRLEIGYRRGSDLIIHCESLSLGGSSGLTTALRVLQPSTPINDRDDNNPPAHRPASSVRPTSGCGDRGYEAWTLRLLAGIAAQDPADLDEAERQFRAAIALATELEMRPLVAQSKHDLGIVLRRRDRPGPARSSWPRPRTSSKPWA